MDKAVPGLDYTTPFKRRSDKDLTLEQRAYNRARCMVRIRRERHPEGENLPDHEVQEQTEKVRPHQRHRLRGGQLGILLKRDGLL